MRNLSALIIEVCMALIAYANPTYYFDHFNIENGLSQNSVNCAFQDTKGFMWFGTKNGLNRFDGYTFKVFMRNPQQPHSIGNSTINCIAGDPSGNLWIGTDKGVYIFNPLLEQFSPIEQLADGIPLSSHNILQIIVHAHRAYILSGIGCYIYDLEKHNLQSLTPTLQKLSVSFLSGICLSGETIYLASATGIVSLSINELKPRIFYKNISAKITCLSINGSQLLAGTSSHGILSINKHTKDLKHLKIPSETNENPLIHSIQTINNDIWVATESGVFIQYANGNTQRLSHHQGDPYSLSNDAVYCIFQDRDKGIWIGSYFGGIDYLPKHEAAFEKYYPSSYHNSISGQRIREICEDSHNNLWIATEDEGLNYFNTTTKKFTNYSSNSTGPIRLSYNNIQCLNLYENKLWIGYFHKGIDVLDLNTKHITHHEQTSTPNSLNNNDIFSIYTDSSGQTWIGTSTGVLKYDSKNNNFIPIPEIGIFYISDIQEDSEGYIWFATYNIGAIRYNPHTKAVKQFHYDPNNPESICYSRITTIFMDAEHRLWFGSEDGGFCLYNNANQTFKRITVNDGLPSNVVHKIIEDCNHNLWISTNNGISCYNIESHAIKNYNTSNGLLCKQFNYNSGIAASDGKLYFGNIAGLIAFRPEDFQNTGNRLSVTLTNFQISNKDIKIGDGNSPLQKAITYSDSIRLYHDQSSFNIEFATLNFQSIESTHFMYKLEGIDNEWITTNGTRASYSNIPPGTYAFHVKANNGSEKWDNPETVLHIVILPPWWLSTIAKIIYGVLFIAACRIIYSSYKKRIRRKEAQRQAEQRQRKQEEIHTAKIEFFTNIAHEIRTPLTLIKIPLESILETENNESQKLKDSLTIIKRNTDRLYSLVNQLLDFRKTESKLLKLDLKQANINSIIEETFLRFRPAMQQRGLTFNYTPPETAAIADIDKEAFTKVVSNLFSNATKYAKSRIDVSLEALSEHHFFELRISNDGKPIKPELQEKVFDAFFQIEETEAPLQSGTGLGLALSRSLIELHHGHIFIDSQQECTTFVVQIPMGETMLPTPEITAPAANVIDEPIERSGNSLARIHTVLVVEDDKDLLRLITEKLQSKYNILAAENGAEAMKFVANEKVDLIVSDILMPIMDGIELCNQVMSDISSCHIPIILLTAKTNLDSKIKALKTGAAAYIEKPFSMIFLEAQIANLLDNRNKLRQNFYNNPFIDSLSITHNKIDERFLDKLSKIIVGNLDDDSFNIDKLAQELNMSRTNFHRKLKGITGLTPGDFIRLVRLKKAAELLCNSEYRINEICIIVGFHSQSHFTKSFQKQFGMLPKDFVKMHKSRQSHNS